METLSFAFGVLAMIATVLVTVVVVGIVKVFNMQKRIESIERWLAETDRSSHQRMSDMHNQLANEMTNDRKELNKRIDQVFRYADSRFDKLDSKITGELSHVKVRISDKQIING